MRSGTTTTHLSPHTKVTFDTTQNFKSPRVSNPFQEKKAASGSNSNSTAVKGASQSYQSGPNTRHRKLAANKKVVVSDIASPVARHSGSEHQLALMSTMNQTPKNDKNLKGQRYQPTEKEIALTNHNKSEMTLGSPKARQNNKVALVATINHRSTYPMSKDNMQETGEVMLSRRKKS